MFVKPHDFFVAIVLEGTLGLPVELKCSQVVRACFFSHEWWIILLVNYQDLLSYLGCLSFTAIKRLFQSLAFEISSNFQLIPAASLVFHLCPVYIFILRLLQSLPLECTHIEYSAIVFLILLDKTRLIVSSGKIDFLLPALFWAVLPLHTAHHLNPVMSEHG